MDQCAIIQDMEQSLLRCIAERVGCMGFLTPHVEVAVAGKQSRKALRMNFITPEGRSYPLPCHGTLAGEVTQLLML